MNEDGNPGIAITLKVIGWIVALIGVALFIGGFSDKTDALVVYGASCIGSALFMLAASAVIEKLTLIEHHSRQIAKSADERRDSASA